MYIIQRLVNVLLFVVYACARACVLASYIYIDCSAVCAYAHDVRACEILWVGPGAGLKLVCIGLMSHTQGRLDGNNVSSSPFPLSPYTHSQVIGGMSDSIAVQSSYVFRAMDRMDRSITAASPVAVAVIGIASLYYVAFSYGLAVVGLLFGRDSVTQVSSIFQKSQTI